MTEELPQGSTPSLPQAALAIPEATATEKFLLRCATELPDRAGLTGFAKEALLREGIIPSAGRKPHAGLLGVKSYQSDAKKLRDMDRVRWAREIVEGMGPGLDASLICAVALLRASGLIYRRAHSARDYSGALAYSDFLDWLAADLMAVSENPAILQSND